MNTKQIAEQDRRISALNLAHEFVMNKTNPTNDKFVETAKIIVEMAKVFEQYTSKGK